MTLWQVSPVAEIHAKVKKWFRRQGLFGDAVALVAGGRWFNSNPCYCISVPGDAPGEVGGTKAGSDAGAGTIRSQLT